MPAEGSESIHIVVVVGDYMCRRDVPVHSVTDTDESAAAENTVDGTCKWSVLDTHTEEAKKKKNSDRTSNALPHTSSMHDMEPESVGESDTAAEEIAAGHGDAAVVTRAHYAV
jgi:hypothetical protein